MNRAPTHIDRIFAETAVRHEDLISFASEHGHTGPLWPVELVEKLAATLEITLEEAPLLEAPVVVFAPPKNPRFIRVQSGPAKKVLSVRLLAPWQKKFPRGMELDPSLITQESADLWLYVGPAPSKRRLTA